MKSLLNILSLSVFAVGCMSEPTGPDPISSKKKLVIIAPGNFGAVLKPYVALKTRAGLNVELVAIESLDASNLGSELSVRNPNYVFLVGDQSIIPTQYVCDPIDWSSAFGAACIYSDYWLTNGKFSIGRLITNNVYDVMRYVARAERYEVYNPTKLAYMLSDRSADPYDAMLPRYQDVFAQSGMGSSLDVLNPQMGLDVIQRPWASVDSLANRLSTADFMVYFGHGQANAWGGYFNLPKEKIYFDPLTTVPVVFAMACETARSAPQAPWAPYNDQKDQVVKLDPSKFWSFNDIPQPAGIQEPGLLNRTMGNAFTTDSDGGALVYIGETVVTNASGLLLDTFMREMVGSYTQPKAIGDMWLNIQTKGTPQNWQIVGDPSTVIGSL